MLVKVYKFATYTHTHLAAVVLLWLAHPLVAAEAIMFAWQPGRNLDCVVLGSQSRQRLKKKKNSDLGTQVNPD